jgi:two-component system NarL family sensor kinase
MRRKLDADILLTQVLIWLVMISYVVVVYVLVIALGTLPFGTPTIDYLPPWWLSLLALLAIASTFLPVYRWVRTSVREIVYNQQDSSHPALTQLNQYLEASSAPDDILPTIVETIARTLKLPYVEIAVQLYQPRWTDEPAAPDFGKPVVFGQPLKNATLERVPLLYHDRSVGELRVSGRRWDEKLSVSDQNILHNIAQQVAIALYAAQLTDDLQHARERLVIAREEERRRIRNDLHDGLAPVLSSLQLQLGAVRNLVRQNPEQAETMISDLREDMRGATADIRQMVYDLRPPMLDELGLIGAMRNSKFQGSDVRIEVIAPEPMPKLPAAVEVAVYRIFSEALHNVVKHAQATVCEMHIEIDGGCLILKVIDNGKSLPADYRAGVGIGSMKERASELGGTLRIQPMEPSGTCVWARIPIESGCEEA